MITLNQYLKKEHEWEKEESAARRTFEEAKRAYANITANRPDVRTCIFIPFCEAVAEKCKEMGAFSNPKIAYYENGIYLHYAVIHDESDPHAHRKLSISLEVPHDLDKKAMCSLRKSIRGCWVWRKISHEEALNSDENLKFILRGAYEIGDSVRVVSKTSRHNGEYGIIRDVSHGDRSDIFRVELESGERVNLALNSLVIFR